MASVYVVMGSESDNDLLIDSGFVKVLSQVLDPDDVKYSICSAHRNARRLDKYVTKAQENGAQLFVGIAGLAAALPGALAGLSDMFIPVIAVPLDEHGIDSCIHMPPGVPVLTAGVGKKGLGKAALAVCQIMAMADGSNVIERRLSNYLETTRKVPQFEINPAQLERG